MCIDSLMNLTQSRAERFRDPLMELSLWFEREESLEDELERFVFNPKAGG